MNTESIDVSKQKAFSTATNIIIGTLLQGATSTFQPQAISKMPGNPTDKVVTTSIGGPLYSNTNDLVEANDEEIIALFVEIEPEYGTTNQLLANL